MFGKGFPAQSLGRIGSFALFFLATSTAFAPLAFAAKVVPAAKTDWIYYTIYLSPQDSTPCLTSDIAMANDNIARSGTCNAAFSHWTSPWPDTDELTPYATVCPSPGVPPSQSGWRHMEQRGYEFTYNAPCSNPNASTGGGSVERHFTYYCPDSENYEIFLSPSGVACRLKTPDTVDPDKQPRQGDCCNVGNPINVATGQKYQRETDYVAMPLRFERHYWNKAWRTTYSRQVVGIYPGLDGVVLVRRDDGQAFTFQKQNGVYVGDTDVKSKLERLTTAGVPTGWRYADDQHTVELYDADGRLTSITTRSGLVQTLAYDVNDRLETVTDSFGKQLTLGYDAAGRLATITDPAGGVYQYGYDLNDDLTTVTAPDLSVRRYLYNEIAHTAGADLPHVLTGVIDENNDRFATFKYDSTGRAVQTEHAGGAERTIVAYNTDGTRTITDALGAARTMTIVVKQNVGKPSTVTGPGCGSCGLAASYVYDGLDNLVYEHDWNGVATYRAYSSDGRDLETYRQEANGTSVWRPITTAWHATYRLPTQIDETGRRTSFTHDASGNVLTKTVRDTATNESRAWTYTYNSIGQVLTADGPRTDVSDVTTYTYYGCTTGSECGQIHTVTNALGHVTTYNTYNAHGQPLTITDPNGVVTTLTYDARERLTSRTVGGEQTTFTYWPTGLLKKATLSDGSFLEYTYDAAHRLTEIEDSEGNRIVYTLDAMGNRTAEQTYDPSTALAQTRTRVFNTLNQLWKETGAAGTASVTTTLSYDANGNQTDIDAPLSRNTVQAYDALNRLKTVTDPLSGVTQYGYNALDQLILVTDPRGKGTGYTYNALGDLKQQVSPDTGTTNNTYDSGGNLQSSTDARSKTATYTYDALNRVASVTYPDQTIGYTYDSGTNQKGRLTQVSDASGSTSWSYDTLGRVLSRQQSMGVTKTLGYAYDSFGRLQTLTLPSGSAITYGYTDGKVTSLTLNGSTTVLSDVLYQPFGPTRGWTWGNSTLAVREYDGDGKITDIDSAGLKSYGYDDAFRITSITDAADSSRSASYAYDPADRLTAFTAGPVTSPSVSLGSSSVAAGAAFSATVNGLPANSDYWVALASTNAAAGTYSRWSAVPATGGTFVWNATAPDFPGTYEVRLFAGGFHREATSAPMSVTPVTPVTTPALVANASAVGAGTSVTVHLTGSSGGAQDWLALAVVGSADTSIVEWTYVGSGITDRDWTVMMPTTVGNYEFRLFLNNGYTRAATSGQVLVNNAPPVAGVSTSRYTYDLNGNRLSDGTSTYTIASASNRLTGITGALARTYSYDNAGNVTGDGTVTFGYNDAGRMVSATKAGVTTTYVLNALGQRVKETGSGSSRYFVYDEDGHLVGEYDSSGILIQETVWLGDIPVATLRPNGSGGISHFYVHADHLNTPRRISRPSDNVVVWRWDSDAFGSTAADEDSDGDSNLFAYGLRFPGQYFDAETGLHYNYFRDYDPQVGRYVESDPIGLEGGINTFAYVAGNPMNDFDLFGLSGKTERIPGGNPTTVRIDKPHVPGQQTHAHVCEKGCKEVVVNKDGTGSHGTDPKKLKNKVKDFLRKRGFKLMVCPPFLEDIVRLRAAEECLAGDPISCRTFQDLGGTIEGPIA